jgi:shikimate kinase
MPSPHHIVFVGLMGSGKTTVGRIVADCLHLPFVDNDDALEDAVHLPAADIQRRRGVVALHDLERQILLEHLRDERPSVIAAAASTIEDDEVRHELSRRAVVVWLRAEIETLVDRVHTSTDRPLSDDPTAMLIEQQSHRAAAYRSIADAVVDTDRHDPERLAKLLASRFAVELVPAKDAGHPADT